MAEATSYDQVLYPGNPFADTHPDHLGVLASLNGMQPAPASRCRALELGCGDGGNLIPMALQYPDSAFVGIDLSARSVAIGEAAIAALGLKNITLAARDIVDLAATEGPFDYIIAHGVYSWVPQPVRDKLLSIYAQALSPHGVGYISYNAFPGAHLRNLARSIMHFHVRAVAEPDARVAQSRMLFKFLAEASPPEEIYGFVLRDQYDRIKSVPDHVLVHDDLDEGSTAFFLYQVVEAAAQHGLQYLADADSGGSAHRPSEQVKTMLAGIPEEEVAAREQYLDFVNGRMFRKSLFCRHDVPLRRGIAAQCVADYYLAATTAPATGDVDVAKPGVVEFKTDAGGRIATDHALSKAALAVLGGAWPQALAFGDLAAQARTLLPTAAPQGERASEEIAALQNVLLQAFHAGQVQLHRAPLPLTAEVSERPRASTLARLQVRQQALVTNLRHDVVMLEDDTARRFLTLLDGTRTAEELRADLATMVDADITHENVMRSLRVLARLGLLLD